ncbi:aminoglycoside phosphotransferase [Streptomyces sp. AV19]|uniref:aminoglycoside phosphotransferase n=1 Tax=Streptomyces sp. AV19 TaxID=2793068 RepID=UPI0018FE16B6|nr:aminoglycoside phosphotransferase [Streptomyces sp. AV19]MBH1938290.1 aminoglycoside phosphotransferase [Streptomyces sp. AV19]MDG4534928.1 aminoglycoside phosphotransferase [Streptomyces sp. AV19]
MSRRLNWDDLPDDVLAAVREHTGTIDRAEPVNSGFSSKIAVKLDTARGRVFVKGMRQDHAETWTQQREEAVNPYVVPLGPRVLWRTGAGGWDLLGFEHLVGRSADYSPGSADLPVVVEALTALGHLGCPDVELEDAGKRWGVHLDDPADAELFAGTALLHTDWNPSNVLITAPDTARHLDWPWATRGAGWIDPACWIVWLVFSGHTPHEAEQWAAKVPVWSTAPDRALDVFSTAHAQYWKRTADDHPNEWTLGLRDAAARWARYRTDSSSLTK